MKQYLAFDIGAGSGRAILGSVSADRLTLREMHRFENKPCEKNGHLFWDMPYLFDQLRQGMRRTAAAGHAVLDGIGVDTWGVDFALLDSGGRLLGNPYMYRDSRTDGMMEKAFAIVPRREIYAITGTQFMQLNTIFQLLSMADTGDPALQEAAHLLFMPDLFTHFLTGEIHSEYTIASTSQLLDARTRRWSSSLMQRLGLPVNIMSPIIEPGTKIGPLKEEVLRETGLVRAGVIAPACHDTASAVAAVPARGENWAYLSSGTWSLIGVENDEPIIDDTSLAANFTNEGGVSGTIRFLSNCMGLWLLQECRRIWEEEDGEEIPFETLIDAAAAAEPFAFLIDPDHGSFLNPEHMPAAIAARCREQEGRAPASRGAFVRCILESLALKYRHIIETINSMHRQRIDVLHIVGGGSRNRLLNQFTADAAGIPVVTGPVEATAAGNIIMQAIAAGQLPDLQTARRLVSASFPLETCMPQNREQWERMYLHFKRMVIAG
ncbi:rhamnulokinase [bacterium]|nr:rhamnulokinase [bacterium]